MEVEPDGPGLRLAGGGGVGPLDAALPFRHVPDPPASARQQAINHIARAGGEMGGEEEKYRESVVRALVLKLVGVHKSTTPPTHLPTFGPHAPPGPAALASPLHHWGVPDQEPRSRGNGRGVRAPSPLPPARRDGRTCHPAPAHFFYEACFASGIFFSLRDRNEESDPLHTSSSWSSGSVAVDERKRAIHSSHIQESHSG